MSQYFPQSNKCLCDNVKSELDLSKYAIKTGLKGAIGIEISTLISNTNFTSFKTKFNNLDVDKPKTVSLDSNKLNNKVDNDAIKKQR